MLMHSKIILSFSNKRRLILGVIFFVSSKFKANRKRLFHRKVSSVLLESLQHFDPRYVF